MTIITIVSGHNSFHGHFVSKYKKLFHCEPEISAVDSSFYPITERNSSLSLEPKGHVTKINNSKPLKQDKTTLITTLGAI